MSKIIAKLGGISAKAGKTKTDKYFTSLTFSKKDKDGNWQKETIFLYPEQWAQLLTIVGIMAEYTAKAEAEKLNARFGDGAPADSADSSDDTPF